LLEIKKKICRAQLRVCNIEITSGIARASYYPQSAGRGAG
jgi:hypothetical protein